MARKSTTNNQTKAESITVRLDPKIRYGLELLARKQRRNLSSVVEWALQKVIYDPKEGLYDDKSDKLNFLNFLWDVEESDRLYKLGICRPELLTFEEEKLIKTVVESDYFIYLTELHQHLNEPGAQNSTEAFHQKMRESIRQHFDVYKKISNGELNKSFLPKIPKGWVAKPPKIETRATNNSDDLIEKWFHTLHNSPVSRDTEIYNRIFAAKEELKKILNSNPNK